MSKKQKNGNDSGTGKAVEKRKHKIRLVKFGDFIVVSLYDLVTWVGIALCVGLVLIYGFQGNQRGVFWSGLALFVLVLIMLAIRAKQHLYPSSNLTKRPELYISGARMTPLVAGQPETVILGVNNRGKAPARNIRLGGGNHFFVSSSFEGPLEYKPVGVDTQPDLGPGEEKTIISRSFEPLSEERIKDLQEGRLLFFHFAEGEYDDDDGTTYPVDFCFMYMPLAPTTMRICPERYWPKERKDRRFPGRPELVIEQVRFETFEAGKAEMVSLQFRNRGKITAKNITIETTFAHKPASFEGSLVYDTVPADTHPTVEPDAVMTVVSRSPWETTPEHIRSVMERSRLLFHYGRGYYEDGKGTRYPISFCYMFEPTLPRNMVIAPDRYWPKEDKKAEG